MELPLGRGSWACLTHRALCLSSANQAKGYSCILESLGPWEKPSLPSPPTGCCFPSQLTENLKVVFSLAATMRATAQAVTRLLGDTPAWGSCWLDLDSSPLHQGWGDQKPWGVGLCKTFGEQTSLEFQAQGYQVRKYGVPSGARL